MYIPKKGDIIHLQFDPASGSEMKGEHYALVVSSQLFNKQGLAFVCPISQGKVNQARSFGTVVTLMGSGTHTQGAVHCHQLKSLDWKSRQAKFKESVPDFIIDDVLLRIEAILSD
ncbi:MULTISPECIES: type II toxin-antitoxin system PemK/MazF family toxin [Pasteurellaceae]|uniref:Type II toxin-antitoxin system PemK/MazF family toxin n=3 Tax=Pasteurellaceae TaxID=712 RepID=A0AAQ4LVZ3_9PAST|nr:type II toxin-antitoxin system PemK/MazF family toxin [Pasteurella atlantica]MBR0572665.1 type II toxin-antitoxin system PemK/MazF family toxin [Pasteurella atlantica]MDP8038610.1 type II toxin-antitoxin system PemK/MazF family toxin [Pasteurella atlantica]MDP8040702.1 type II toxin-antitoxin system PemK/MazF family toxin [Pasteurella atlantica]MDP8042837.1 type II toxin-antitoxin system PemK/MazF family toxin [Pasteurella atlantica]MDP8044924.1 type II toxin-antitoxin system PemK/MazF fami